MTVKELEQSINNYINDKTEYNHKEKALEEFDKIHEKFTLDELVHIGFIINDYPEYDHCLFKVSGGDFFVKFGLSRKYMMSLNKKDIHKLAKGLWELFGKYNLIKKE